MKASGKNEPQQHHSSGHNMEHFGKLKPEPRHVEKQTDHDGLEELVRKRTAELIEANARLRDEIAERERAEKELREEKEFISAIFQKSYDGIAVLNKKGKVKLVSPAMARLFGYDPTTSVQHFDLATLRYWAEVFFPDPSSKAQFVNLWCEDVESANPPERTFQITWPNGEKRWCRFQISRMEDDNVVVNGQDITERKLAEEALRLSEERYCKILDSTHDHIVVLDEDVRVLFANKAWLEHTAYEIENLNARTPFEKIHPDDREKVKKWFKMVVAGEPLRNIEYRRICKQGEVRWVGSNVNPIHWPGARRAIVNVARDITEQKQADATLRETLQQFRRKSSETSALLEALRDSETRYRRLSESLERMVKEQVDKLRQSESLAAIGQMVSVVAHEVRNPLQNIKMGIDILRNQLSGDKENLEVLEGIRFGTDQLKGIIQDLLEYSKPVRLQPSACSVRKIVEGALKALSHEFNKMSVNLELELEDREISVDAVKFTAVLVNLFTNAVEAMPDGGTLKVRSHFFEEDGADFLRLSIADNGCGIDDEHFRRVHEPFFTTKARGTGLGLPVCIRIIDAHNGTLEISSKAGEGTVVNMTMPA